MDKWTEDVVGQVLSMLTVVRQVLSAGTEDAAFILDGDILLLTRLNGTVVRHRREKWWANYDSSSS